MLAVGGESAEGECTIKLIRQSGAVEPDDVLVLLTAPTGVAAFNVNGMTLHSAFLLGKKVQWVSAIE